MTHSAQPPHRGTSTRRWISILGLFALVVLLLGALMMASGLNVQTLWSTVAGVGVPTLCVLMAGTFGHMLFGALKWRLVMKKTGTPSLASERFGFFFFYTCLGSALSQFLTVYLSVATIRGLAVRRHHEASFVSGAASSGFEQMMDAYVLVFMVPPAIAAVFLGGGLVQLAALFTSALLSGALLVWFIPYSGLTRTIPDALARRRWRPIQKLGAALQHAERADLFDGQLLHRLLLFSVLRYVSIFARTAALAFAVLPDLSFRQAATAFALVQSSQLLALTPGNLGITEWSWAGVLVALGARFDESVQFAIALRVLVSVSVLLMLVLACLWFLGRMPNSVDGVRPVAKANNRQPR